MIFLPDGTSVGAGLGSLVGCSVLGAPVGLVVGLLVTSNVGSDVDEPIVGKNVLDPSVGDGLGCSVPAV